MDDINKFIVPRISEIKNSFLQAVFSQFSTMPTSVRSFVLNAISGNINSLYPSLTSRLASLRGRYLVYQMAHSDTFYRLHIHEEGVFIDLGNANSIDKALASVECQFGKLLEIVNGEADGDALFFSRDINVQGDMDALVLIRNTIESIEFDLPKIFLLPFGVFSSPMHSLLRFADNRIKILDEMAERYVFGYFDDLNHDLIKAKNTISEMEKRISKLERLTAKERFRE